MLKPVKQLVTTALVSTIALLPNSTAATLSSVSVASIVLSADAALAKGQKDKKDKKEKRDKKPKKPAHAAVASELKNLNAARSLRNGQSYLYASADSNTGQIATYGFAEYALGAAESDLADALFGLDDALAYLADCAEPPLGFACDPVIQAERQMTIDAYGMAVSDFMDASVAFEDVGSAIDVGELTKPALQYINALLEYGDFSTPDTTEPTVVADIDIADISFDF